VQTQVALLLEWDGRLLVRKRALDGMLGGLWEFPAARVAEGKDPAVVVGCLLAELGLGGELREAGAVRHAYSHFNLDLRCYRGVVDGSLQVGENGESRWLELAGLKCLALHGAHKKVLALLASNR
jgi:A/G-specific adenine glycosylase